MGSPEPEEAPRLGEQLRRIREGLGLTLRQVQQETKVSGGHLSLIETGQVRNPSPSVIQRLTAFYGVDSKDLLTAAGYLQGTDDAARRDAVANLSLTAIEGLDEADLAEVQEFIRYLRQKKKSRPRKTVNS